MSNSVKKNPVVKDNSRGSNKKSKRLANRKVRRKLKDVEYTVADGKSYRKEYESWIISDYSTRMTEQEALEYYHRFTDPNNVDYDPMRWVVKECPTEKEFMRWWKKTYKRK